MDQFSRALAKIAVAICVLFGLAGCMPIQVPQDISNETDCHYSSAVEEQIIFGDNGEIISYSSPNRETVQVSISTSSIADLTNAVRSFEHCLGVAPSPINWNLEKSKPNSMWWQATAWETTKLFTIKIGENSWSLVIPSEVWLTKSIRIEDVRAKGTEILKLTSSRTVTFIDKSHEFDLTFNEAGGYLMLFIESRNKDGLNAGIAWVEEYCKDLPITESPIFNEIGNHVVLHTLQQSCPTLETALGTQSLLDECRSDIWESRKGQIGLYGGTSLIVWANRESELEPTVREVEECLDLEYGEFPQEPLESKPTSYGLGYNQWVTGIREGNTPIDPNQDYIAWFWASRTVPMYFQPID